MLTLLSGGTGFLGNIIRQQLQAPVETIGRRNSVINMDFVTGVPLFDKQYDLVVHAAGKAHLIPKTSAETQAFYDVNVGGTRNLLKGLSNSQALPKSFLFISTVAVYGLEKGHNINESTPRAAKDAYGLSKIEAEDLVSEWCSKNGVTCGILRLPLIAGKQPKGNLEAMINGIGKGFYFDIAGNTAKKSIVLAEDVAQVIPEIAAIGGTYNLTDRVHPALSDLSSVISAQLGRKKPGTIPRWFAGLLAAAGDLAGESFPINTRKLDKLTNELTFDDTAAVQKLGWNPRSVLEHFKI